ncbi:MAG: DUF4438 domain-containing protein, partial [Bifidobacteriaceae bacterium]|nr:DUF4438 domain-containing protein [Bifidobacteriaceae bacterium]
MSRKDNRAELVQVSVRAFVAPPRIDHSVGADAMGRFQPLPGNGGITIGCHVGDPLPPYGVSDHLMPGASLEANPAAPGEVGAAHLLACVGNDVFDAAGRFVGLVVGKRGGLAPGF